MMEGTQTPTDLLSEQSNDLSEPQFPHLRSGLLGGKKEDKIGCQEQGVKQNYLLLPFFVILIDNS